MKAFFGLIALMTVAAAAGEYQQQHYHQTQQHYQEPQHHYHQESQQQHHYEHLQPKKHIPIVKSENNRNHDGSYSFNYETGNGIHAQEHGYIKNAGHKDAETQVAEGYFSYTGEDGVPIGLKYVADEHGFRPEGAHLPTPPPIPHEIQEALAKIAANPHHGHEDDDEGQYSHQQHYQQHEQEAQYAHQPNTYNHHQSSSGYQHQHQQQQQQHHYKY